MYCAYAVGGRDYKSSDSEPENPQSIPDQLPNTQAPSKPFSVLSQTTRMSFSTYYTGPFPNECNPLSLPATPKPIEATPLIVVPPELTLFNPQPHHSYTVPQFLDNLQKEVESGCMNPDNFARQWNEAANGLNEADRVRANGLYQSQFRDKLIDCIGQLQDKLLEEAEEGNASILEAPIPANARWLELQTQQFIDNAVRSVMENPSPALQEVRQIPPPVAQVMDTIIWNYQEGRPTQLSEHEMTQVLNQAFEHNHQESVFPVVNNRSPNSLPPSLISISSSDKDLTKNYQDYNTMLRTIAAQDRHVLLKFFFFFFLFLFLLSLST
jgi:hypothetical protein